jgi:hypothetical protein
VIGTLKYTYCISCIISKLQFWSRSRWNHLVGVKIPSVYRRVNTGN